MDVNRTIERVFISLLEAAKPQDSSHYGIASRRIHGHDFAGRTPLLEFHSERGVATDFGRDLELPEGRAVAPGNISQTEFGGGDRVTGNLHPFVVKGHPLFGDADSDHMIPIPKTRGKEASCGCENSNSFHGRI